MCADVTADLIPKHSNTSAMLGIRVCVCVFNMTNYWTSMYISKTSMCLGINSTDLWNCTGRINSIVSHFEVLIVLGESTVKHISPKPPIGVHQLRSGNYEGRSMWFIPFSKSSNNSVSLYAFLWEHCGPGRHSYQDRNVLP